MIKRNLTQALETTEWERQTYEADDELKAINAKIEADPENSDLWMEKGLYLSQFELYREAEECYAHAISIDPFKGILYRHRAHRFLSQWRFEDARADFTIASRLIPENWDVWYHLGLSNFLLGDYEKAQAAYQTCLELSKTDDELIAICDWYYMTLLRLGRKDETAKLLECIHEGMEYGDNWDYYRRLLMYKGLVKPEEVLPEDLSKLEPLDVITLGFGLSNYYWFNGEKEKSDEVIDLILKAGDEGECWFAFGYLAAKVDKKNRAM